MTEKRIYELKDLFFRIRQFYFGAGRDPLASIGVDKGETAEYVSALRRAEDGFGEKEEGKPLASDADAMLLYTVSHIKDALLSKNYRLAGDLAELGARLCGVYVFPAITRKRFLQKYLLPLREKHGDELFAELLPSFLKEKNTRLALVPSFSTRMRGARYYEEDSDAEMLEAHPVLYALFAVFGMLLFIGAIVAYALLLDGNGPLDILGFLGAAVFGVGLFSFPMAFIHQYMGHRMTFSLLGVGALFALLSVLL